MEKLNPDYRKRDKIIGIEVDWEKGGFGGTASYVGLTYDKLLKLKKGGFLDPEENQNGSPTIEEFMTFMKDHPDCTAHGYVVSPYRDDYRVSIEGLACPKKKATKRMIQDFVDFCRFADELEVLGDLYSWWD